MLRLHVSITYKLNELIDNLPIVNNLYKVNMKCIHYLTKKAE